MRENWLSLLFTCIFNKLKLPYCVHFYEICKNEMIHKLPMTFFCSFLMPSGVKFNILPYYTVDDIRHYYINPEKKGSSAITWSEKGCFWAQEKVFIISLCRSVGKKFNHKKIPREGEIWDNFEFYSIWVYLNIKSNQYKFLYMDFIKGVAGMTGL